ncbi:hypothetical protein R3P38DRAFT_2797512 [Favolaschia claudopus]|uniref:Zn(2)-C6 fungal-type domain-containing protein n=1 Tax=Favolaschia claudopus TaxID=2862362 RepID=A0AAW0A2Q0_9AGAR
MATTAAPDTPFGSIDKIDAPRPVDASNDKHRRYTFACSNCRKACRKCDKARPCTRCVRLGTETTCTSTLVQKRKYTKRSSYRKKPMICSTKKAEEDFSTVEDYDVIARASFQRDYAAGFYAADNRAHYDHKQDGTQYSQYLRPYPCFWYPYTNLMSVIPYDAFGRPNNEQDGSYYVPYYMPYHTTYNMPSNTKTQTMY